MGKRLSKTKFLDAAIGLVITNLDLLFEIFLHIPAKSLIRLKLVSKIWLSLISDPNFAFAHTSRNTIKSPISDLCYKSYSGEFFIPLNEMSIFPSTTCLGLMRQKYVPNFHISHSCNGLIVFRLTHIYHPLVFNPTTQKYRLLVIPSDYYRIIKGSSWNYLLAYEPLESQHYKLVLLCTSGSTSVAFIFSSQSGSWNEFPITATSAKCCTRKIYWNRAIHWLTQDNVHVQLDVDAVELTEISLPSKPRILGREKIVYFGESDGRLFLIQCHRRGAPGFRMLEMDTNTHRWAVKHLVNLRPLVSEFPELQPKPSVQSFQYSVLYVKSGAGRSTKNKKSGADRKSYSLVIAINKKVVLYDVKKGKRSTKILCNCSTLCIGDNLSEFAHPLIPSLAPV